MVGGVGLWSRHDGLTSLRKSLAQQVSPYGRIHDKKARAHMTWAEIVNALASFAGGAVGGVFAIIAVYVALSAQRHADAARVSAAVRTEIASLVVYVIGAIRRCQDVVSGTRKVPAADAGYIVRKLSTAPVVYEAVADKIGLLPHPEATVQFYMRINEAKSHVGSLERRAENEARENPVLRAGLVPPDSAVQIADSLIIALQLARAILSDEERISSAWVHHETIGKIDACFESARASFPDAESFKQPPQDASG
jgi:hypothetical protein